MSRRPRYVIVTWGVVPGGTLSVLRQWVPRLERAGTATVVSLGPDRASLGVPTVQLGGRWSHPLRFPHVIPYVARMSLAAARAARGPAPAVLLPQDALATGAAAALAAWLTGSRLVVMEHGSLEASATERFWRERYPAAGRVGRLRQRLLRLFLAAAARLVVRRLDLALIAGDDTAAAYRARGVGADRIHRYRFPVHLDRFRPAGGSERGEARARWRVAGDALVVVTVSRLTAEKGIDELLAVAAELRSGAAPMELLVAGDGPLRGALERRAAELGVAARFLGRLEADEVASLHRAADVFVYSGRQGANTPYAVLEAMASGLPVVATTAPAVHAAMLADGRGLAVPPDDPRALGAAIGRFLDDAQLRSAAGSAARAYVEEHHAPEQLDAEVAAFVRRLFPDADPPR